MSELNNTSKSSSNTACCGSYEELSPTEFNRHKELVVVLLRSEHASTSFDGFNRLIPADDVAHVVELVSQLPAGQPIGLVCPDGECSGRLAIRLSNMGYPVYHLGGGLMEWFHSFRGNTVGHA